MSTLVATTKHPYGDEWVQLQCDDCGTLSPRVEITAPKRGPLPEDLHKLAKQFAGFVEHLRPWRKKSGRRGKGMAVHDLCRGCAFKACVAKLISDFGGPFGPPPDDRHPETT